jgi:hypothetical protein
VFQVSAIREALSEHGVEQHGDSLSEPQRRYRGEQSTLVPSQQVIDGSLDVAAAWGPMAGYYKAVLACAVGHPAGQPDGRQVPMEFDMTLAVPRGRPDIKAAVEKARSSSTRTRYIRFSSITACRWSNARSACVSGDLPSHGPYAESPNRTCKPPLRSAKRCASMPQNGGTEEVAGAGRNPDDELERCDRRQRHRSRALPARKHGAHVDSVDGEGNTG